jgi:signal transduction histidine kinase
MTIRRRLTLSFLAILVLFALNLVIYFWGNRKRQATVEDLRRAISRQALIATIRQNLSDVQKQVTLLSQIATDTGVTPAPGAGAGPGDVSQFGSQLEAIDRTVGEFQDLSDAQARPKVDIFAKTTRDLIASWRVYYGSFGTDPSKAITELAVRADPLSQTVLQQLLPQLQKDENLRVESASANFYEVARLTDRIIILIFLASTIVAVAVAYRVSRHLTRGLTQLEQGATAIGGGNLDQRIAMQTNDELGDLARAFNDMTDHLSAARAQLTLAHELERNKSAELEKAMEQLRKAQDQLIVQQKLASLGSLTAGIAHEIKNPLNFVTNFAEICGDMVDEIRESLDASKDRMIPEEFSNLQDLLADLQQNTGKIKEHGKRADSIVRGMLMHSRGQAGERQSTDINVLLAEHISLAYHGMRAQNSDFNITIEESYDASLKPLSVVPQDLSRVFLNIANNACYAAYGRKSKSDAGFSPKLSVSTKDAGENVEIRIRDNGEGIPEEIRSKIFEPFFTTKPAGSGTGLGLSMSHDIVVQEHKGAIRVESEPGRYTEFIVTLPKG